MKKAFFLIFIGSLIFLTACKKSSPAPKVITTRIGNVYDDSSRISTLYYYSPTYLLDGSYDDSGRNSLQCHYLNGQSVTNVSLHYALQNYLLYFWNNQSLADSSNILSSTGGLEIRKKFSYDNNGFLTGVKWYNHGNSLVLTETFTVSGGNITQHTYNVIDTSNATLPRGSYAYSYYSGNKNTLGNVYFGQPYLGASSANPVKSSTYTYGSTSSTVDYTYHYSNGCISSQLIYADSAGIGTTRIDSLSFGYYIQ